MIRILSAIVFGAIIGVAYAKLPPAPATSDAEKAAETEKAAAAKAKEAADLTKAQDKAVANYKRNAAASGSKKQ